MWLLHTQTLRLSEFHGDRVPHYSILSHTWSGSELLFHEVEMAASSRESDAEHVNTPAQKRRIKVEPACRVANDRGFEWIWIDSCCIDKRSSAELTESLNSMYQWYQGAQLCIIHLADVGRVAHYENKKIPGSKAPDPQAYRERWFSDFKRSRWFKRGWTLQELLATKNRLWVSSSWTTIDDSSFTYWDTTLLDSVAEITRIPIGLLRDTAQLSRYSVAERMSWASRRFTERPEDRAYSLLGLFNIHMPILYGEGLQAAFRRLQLEIMKTSFDQSIFAWRSSEEVVSGLLAKSPTAFANTPSNIRQWWPSLLAPYSMTNVGLQIRCVVSRPASEDVDTLLAVLQCEIETSAPGSEDKSWGSIAVKLQRHREATCWVNGAQCAAWFRVDCNRWHVLSDLEGCPVRDLVVMKYEQSSLVFDAMWDHNFDDGRSRSNIVVNGRVSKRERPNGE